jgi:geranylgeranyl diphosphate synthase, type II
MKTAYLIEFSAYSGALIAGASENELICTSEFGLNLGLAFQIKDDLLDIKDGAQDHKSYVSILGIEQTLYELKKKSKLAEQALQQLQNKSAAFQDLNNLININIQRDS